MKLLFVNSGLHGIPEGYSTSIINSLVDNFEINVREIWPQNLTCQIIDEFNPDWLFVFHGNLTNLNLINYARKKGILTLLWVVEDPYELDVHTKEWIESYNYIFTNEIRTVSYYNSNNVFYLPWCTSINVYKPEPVCERYKSDLCFVGMGFENRVNVINQLEKVIVNLNVKLIGNWSRWGKKLKPSLGKFVLPPVTDPGEVAKYYNGARINLNIHRNPHLSINVNKASIPADSLNNRTFDIAGTGSFQIVDNSRSELSNFYTPGKEIIIFNSIDELKKKIKYYLTGNEQERYTIGRKAHLRTVNYHTFEDRLKIIFYNCLDAKLIKGKGQEIYYIKDKKRHHITSIEAFMANGFKPNSEINVSEKIVSIFSEGAPIE